MSTTKNIVLSFTGHSYKSVLPNQILNLITRALDEKKYINLSSGRLVSAHRDNAYWYFNNKNYPFAIPYELALSQSDANAIFIEYINLHYCNNTTTQTVSYYESDDDEEDQEDQDEVVNHQRNDENITNRMDDFIDYSNEVDGNEDYIPTDDDNNTDDDSEMDLLEEENDEL